MILNDSLTFNVESFRTITGLVDSGGAGSARATPVFEGQEKRTERALDNLLLLTRTPRLEKLSIYDAASTCSTNK